MSTWSELVRSARERPNPGRLLWEPLALPRLRMCLLCSTWTEAAIHVAGARRRYPLCRLCAERTERDGDVRITAEHARRGES